MTGPAATSPASWLLGHAARTPDAPAVDAPGQRLSYAALADRVLTLAGALAARGIGPGDRVVVALPFSPAAAIATLAIQALGACSIEIDRAMGAQGFAAIAEQSRPKLALAMPADGAAWAAAGVPTLRADAREGTPPSAASPVGAADPALIVFTSGSTGRPRGVIQTYGNIEANTRSIVEYLGITAEDRALSLLPFHYCYGKSVLQTHLLAGGSVFVEARFMYPRTAMDSLGQEGCTSFAGVPTTFEILRRDVDVAALARPRLRYLTQAGGRMHPDTIRWVREAFRPADLFVMYGQTEATARLSYLPPARAEEKHGSIGVAIPGVTLAVVDEQARPVADGETGHLVARGGNVTPGYLDAPEETAAILHDGWLWTGDLARRDADGFFFITGRAKEILKIGGFRVSPVEIEDTLRTHPAVADAAVVGAPDPIQGEIAIGFVVLRAGQAAAEDELRRTCKERLAPYKVPARVVALQDLPRNAAGKPLKAALHDLAREAARGPAPEASP